MLKKPLHPFSIFLHRLTAFVLKSFAQAKQYVFIDQSEITSSMHWIMSQQRADGSFPALGRLFNKEIQVWKSTTLTVYENEIEN